MNTLTKRVHATLLGLIIGLAVPLAALSQDEAIMPNYRNADINQVIDAVGQVTGRNFAVNPQVRGQVNLFSYTPMTVDAFYQAFLTMLQINGFVAMPAGDVEIIIPEANARQIPGVEAGGQGAQFVTRTVELENVGAAQLVPILRPMVATNAHMAAHPNSNMLIIVDRAANMDRVVNVIRRIDQAGLENIEYIPLEYASADRVVQTLASLTQSAQAAGGAPGVTMIADDRTNSVLLRGTASARLPYRALIVQLDTETTDGGETQVRYLNYADSEDLAAKLEAQFGAGLAAADGAEGGPNAGPVTIWSDQGTNALVINAPPRVRNDMMSVIDQIDIRRLQVQVDAIIVEVSVEKAAQFGVTFAADGSGGDDAVAVTNFSIGGGIVQLAAAAGGGTPDPSAVGTGVLVGVGSLSDGGTSWAAVVSALRGDASTNVIAEPTIVTLDNEEAEIVVAQEIPFLTGSFASTGAAGGSVNPFQTIEREEVGTTLKITPQINEGSGVKLVIEQEISGVSSAAGAVDIVTTTRRVLTTVFVDDGDMLVLGGLIDDQLRQSEQRVPVLGRIPGLGWLFRARKTDRVKTNLMLFIRPTILYDGVQASAETSKKYEYVRTLQEEQAERPVQLMREETHPALPELPPPATSTPVEPE